jgi:hypothetical protein
MARFITFKAFALNMTTNRRPRSPSSNHNVKQPISARIFILPEKRHRPQDQGPAGGVGAVYRLALEACQTELCASSVKIFGPVNGVEPDRRRLTTPCGCDSLWWRRPEMAEGRARVFHAERGRPAPRNAGHIRSAGPAPVCVWGRKSICAPSGHAGPEITGRRYSRAGFPLRGRSRQSAS